MNIFLDEHQELLHKLVEHDVRFMLIGGYAVIHYGYSRTTGDMDIWLDTGNENRDKLISALHDFGIEERGLTQLKVMDFANPVPVFFIGEPPRRVDFITKISSLGFAEAFAEVNYFEMDGKNVPVIHYNHLILSKLTSERLKDKADIEELQKINRYRKHD